MSKTSRYDERALLHLVYGMLDIPLSERSISDNALKIVNTIVQLGIVDRSSIYLREPSAKRVFLIAAKDTKRRAFVVPNISLYYSSPELPFKYSFEEGEGIAGHVLVNKVPVYVPQVEQEPRYTKKGGPVKSILVIPLLVGGKAIGVINLSAFSHRHISEELRDMLMHVAPFFALVLDHARLHVKHNTTSVILSALMDYTDKAVIILDKENRVIFANSVTSELLGIDLDDLYLLPVQTFLPTDKSKLDQYLHTLYPGKKAEEKKKIVAANGTISRFSLDDEDSKTVAKAVRRRADGQLVVFDIVSMKVLDKEDTPIGRIEIWGASSKDVKGPAPLFYVTDTQLNNKLISRLSYLKNEIENKHLDGDFLTRHIDELVAELRGHVGQSQRLDLHYLLTVAHQLYKQHNNIKLTIDNKVPFEAAADCPPYRVIEVFYLVFDLILKFGNPAMASAFSSAGITRQEDDRDILTVQMENRDLLIPTMYIKEQVNKGNKLLQLMKDMGGLIAIERQRAASIIRLNFPIKGKTNPAL